MSVEAITWALKQPIRHSTAKFVLVAMANLADAEMVAWPSIAYLIEATGQDRKTVQANVQRLRNLGYIEDTGARSGKTKQVVVYRLKTPETGPIEQAQNRNTSENGTVPKFPSKRPVFPSKGARFSHETGPKTGHGTVKDTSMDTSRTRNKDSRANPVVAPNDVPESVWSDFVAMRKAKRAPITETAIAGIRREADAAGMTLAEALAMCCERGWQGFNAGWVVRPPARAAPTRQDRISATVAELTGRARNQPDVIDVDVTERTA